MVRNILFIVEVLAFSAMGFAMYLYGTRVGYQNAINREGRAGIISITRVQYKTGGKVTHEEVGVVFDDGKTHVKTYDYEAK